MVREIYRLYAADHRAARDEKVGALLDELDALRFANKDCVDQCTQAVCDFHDAMELVRQYSAERDDARAAVKRLKDALFQSYIDASWNAYYTGHADNNGMFDNCCMSDPEWLQGAITGSRKRSNSVPVKWLTEQITDLATAMVQAVVEGVDPYDVCLGRTP
jgi:hypothetical protein